MRTHFLRDESQTDPVFRHGPGDPKWGTVLFGLAVPFGVVAEPHERTRASRAPLERFVRGAFRRALEGNAYDGIELRFAHPDEASTVIASTRASSLVVSEMNDGLRFEARLPKGSGFVRRMLEMQRFGCSVSVVRPTGETRTHRGELCHEVRDVARLDHIAITPNPVYRDTWVRCRTMAGETSQDRLDQLFGSRENL